MDTETDMVRIVGQNDLYPKNEFQLLLPRSLHFNKNHAEKTLLPTKRQESNFIHKFAFERKTGNDLDVNCCLSKDSEDGQFLNYKLERNPLPLNMGPVLPPVDRKLDDLRCERVIVERTAFLHDSAQKCGKWIPKDRDNSELFPKYEVEIYADQNVLSEKGPYSDPSMAIVYTCNHLKCSIYCSCKICNSSNKADCLLICKNYSCKECIPQCPEHKIGLDRTFSVEEHCYSIKSDYDDSVKFVVKHSGIPLSCKNCRIDLADHQQLHKVFHSRCKFCKQLMSPFDYHHVVTTEDYALALDKISFRANVTCAMCLKMFADPAKRRRHEKSIHEKTPTYKCDKCVRAFCNKNDLKYHDETTHEKTEPEICEICNKTFKTKASLKIHQGRLHSDLMNFKCEDCGANFKHKCNLSRHENEKHFGHNIDWRLVQFTEDLKFTCDICSKLFTRKSTLDEHKHIVHGNPATKHKCQYCSKEFNKLFDAKRHEKQCQKHEELEEQGKN